MVSRISSIAARGRARWVRASSALTKVKGQRSQAPRERVQVHLAAAAGVARSHRGPGACDQLGQLPGGVLVLGDEGREAYAEDRDQLGALDRLLFQAGQKIPAQ